MSEIAQAIANRRSEIDRLQAEIKALTDVEQILAASAPTPRSTCRGTVETALKGILRDKRRTFEELMGALGRSEESERGWLFAAP